MMNHYLTSSNTIFSNVVLRRLNRKLNDTSVYRTVPEVAGGLPGSCVNRSGTEATHHSAGGGSAQLQRRVVNVPG